MTQRFGAAVRGFSLHSHRTKGRHFYHYLFWVCVFPFCWSSLRSRPRGHLIRVVGAPCCWCCLGKKAFLHRFEARRLWSFGSFMIERSLPGRTAQCHTPANHWVPAGCSLYLGVVFLLTFLALSVLLSCCTR